MISADEPQYEMDCSSSFIDVDDDDIAHTDINANDYESASDEYDDDGDGDKRCGPE
ncbi:MAG: hypothetical protein ACI8RD_004761 [Bacillariaceae sp.]|jgi:hypothetical protein